MTVQASVGFHRVTRVTRGAKRGRHRLRRQQFDGKRRGWDGGFSVRRRFAEAGRIGKLLERTNADHVDCYEQLGGVRFGGTVENARQDRQATDEADQQSPWRTLAIIAPRHIIWKLFELLRP